MRTVLPAFACAAALLLAACAGWEGDRCYVPVDRYAAMKELFVATGSMQRVEDAMEDENWAACERNQFRYLLRKDLYLDDVESAPPLPPTGQNP